MKKIKGGYTIWARQSIDSDIFFCKPDKWFKIWFFIVNTVNYKQNRLFEKGQELITYEDIMKKTKATKTQTYKAIRFFKEKLMIDAEKTTRGFIIKVLNYGKYQDANNYIDDRQTTDRRQTDDKEANTITKEYNKEINNIYMSYKEKICRDCKLTSKSKYKINTRLKEFKEHELLTAIDKFSKNKWRMENNADKGIAWFFNSEERISTFLLLKEDLKPKIKDFNSLLKQ